MAHKDSKAASHEATGCFVFVSVQTNLMAQQTPKK